MVLSAPHENINNVGGTKKEICGQRRWLVVVGTLLVRESYSLSTSIGLCFSVRNWSDKTPLTPGSRCAVCERNRLKHRHATAPGCSHAVRARSSRAVCAVNAGISHRLRAGKKSTCREKGLTRWRVQGL